MNNKITHIELYSENSYHVQYLGTLINQRKFHLWERVWFGTSTLICRATVIGIAIEVTDSPYPSYLYTLKLDKEYLDKMNERNELSKGENSVWKNIKCTTIFKSFEEAKKSLIGHFELHCDHLKDKMMEFIKNSEEVIDYVEKNRDFNEFSSTEG